MKCCCCLVVKSHLTLATPWTVAHQASLSMGFSRQEYWSGLPFPCPSDLPSSGIEPTTHQPQTGRPILYHGAAREAHMKCQGAGIMSGFSSLYLSLVCSFFTCELILSS